jgi:hypothetical protein
VGLGANLVLISPAIAGLSFFDRKHWVCADFSYDYIIYYNISQETGQNASCVQNLILSLDQIHIVFGHRVE